MTQSGQELFLDCLSQFIRGNDFHIRPIAEDIKDQFTGIAVGQAELIGAIIQPASLLIGMPLFSGNPAGAFRSKKKGCRFVRRTGKDAEGLGVIAVQLLIVYFNGLFFEDVKLLNPVEGKGTEVIAFVTPGVEIPVFPVIDEALRGDNTAENGIVDTITILQIQLIALQSGAGCGMEMFRWTSASADTVKAEPAKNLIGRQILLFHDRFDAVPDEGKLISKQAGLHPADEFMDSEQGMQLGYCEPESG